MGDKTSDSSESKRVVAPGDNIIVMIKMSFAKMVREMAEVDEVHPKHDPDGWRTLRERGSRNQN